MYVCMYACVYVCLGKRVSMYVLYISSIYEQLFARGLNTKLHVCNRAVCMYVCIVCMYCMYASYASYVCIVCMYSREFTTVFTADLHQFTPRSPSE